MKLMLKERRSHIAMRTMIYLMEKGGATSAENPVVLSHTEGVLHNHFLEVGQAQFLQDVKEIATFSSEYLTVELIKSSKKGSLHRLTHQFGTCYFSVPTLIARKKVVKAEDAFEKDIQDVYNHWLKHIGSISRLFKRKPTLNKVRRKYIKQALGLATAKELKMAIDGCLNSPHHMGFTIEQRTSQVTESKHYCEPEHIMRNKNRIEQMISRTHLSHYEKQVEEAQSRSRVRNVGFDVSASDINDLVGSNDLIETDLPEVAPSVSADDDFNAWLAEQ
jgi:hypothetical protein